MADSAYLRVLFSFKQLQHISMSSKEMKSSNSENPKYEDFPSLHIFSTLVSFMKLKKTQ